MAGGGRFTGTFAEWLMPKVRIEDCGYETPCWVWDAGLTEKGYARTRLPKAFGRRRVRVHREAYCRMVAPIPDELVADHLCRNRACCNPEHVEPVTVAENTRRGENWLGIRTHCLRGHPYDEANTRINRNGSRTCRACFRAYMRDWRRRRAA